VGEMNYFPKKRGEMTWLLHQKLV